MKKFLLTTLAIASLGMLTACGKQSSPTNHRNITSTSSSSTANDNQNNYNDGRSTASSHHQSGVLWNSSKDKQLEGFMNSWAPTMHQSYEKYSGDGDLHVNVGMDYPSGFSKEVTPDGGSIGWSPSGKGPYDYNVVAIYNYNHNGGGQLMRITYFFTFHNGKPVALVDQTNNGDPTCRPTANVNVSSNFEKIANGQN
ncbi:DUF4767 domain-containing protein [uncultured Limosilactobacillus sp.]|uniref:DUF4767 domain-containing protein n=1 Tax=uncultured Limosilactobacillus sp. TaxID=2837629 RepID=UPI0025E5F8B7|nr:DUF4767 domain-containing protein [uncultured Limosilactobacillus sp.]